jgi:hypothetical protein
MRFFALLCVIYAFVLYNIASADFLFIGRYSGPSCARNQVIELLSQNFSTQNCSDLMAGMLATYGNITGCFSDKYKSNVWTQITCSTTNQFNSFVTGNMPGDGIVTTTYLSTTCTGTANVFSQMWQILNTCVTYANLTGSVKTTKI